MKRLLLTGVAVVTAATSPAHADYAEEQECLAHLEGSVFANAQANYTERRLIERMEEIHRAKDGAGPDILAAPDLGALAQAAQLVVALREIRRGHQEVWWHSDCAAYRTRPWRYDPK